MGLLLLGGFGVYFRATWLSLELLGIALVVAVSGVFVWVLADCRLVDVGSPMVVILVVEVNSHHRHGRRHVVVPRPAPPDRQLDVDDLNQT